MEVYENTKDTQGQVTYAFNESIMCPALSVHWIADWSEKSLEKKGKYTAHSTYY